MNYKPKENFMGTTTVTKQKKIKCRNIVTEDYAAICKLQLECFPGMKPWSIEQFESIISIFPQGQFCIEYNGKIVASSCSLIIVRNEYSENAGWNELTNNGFI